MNNPECPNGEWQSQFILVSSDTVIVDSTASYCAWKVSTSSDSDIWATGPTVSPLLSASKSEIAVILSEATDVVFVCP